MAKVNPDPDRSIACPACDSALCEECHSIAGFPIFRCEDCSLRFVPRSSLTAVDYDKLYDESGDYKHHLKRARVMKSGGEAVLNLARQLALRTIKALKPARVLDIGCGVGGFLSEVQSLGLSCYGVEPSGNAIEAAKQYLACPLHHGHFSEDVFPGVEFDAISTWEVIEHVSDVQPFIRGIAKRLRPGGSLFLSTPNYESQWMWGDVPHDPRAKPPVHVTFWTLQSLRNCLERNGLRVLTIRQIRLPVNSGRRSGKLLGKYRAALDAVLRPSQRKTLYVHAIKPEE